MRDSYRQILNLIHRFAAHFDAGEFKQAADLFDPGHFLLSGDRKVSADEMLAMWSDILILYDGSPRTRHTITNHIVDIDRNGCYASCASCYTVMQQVPGGPLNTILTGRYIDTFRPRDGNWIFRSRDYRHVEFVGDVSQHLKPHMSDRLQSGPNVVSLETATA